MRDFLHAKRRVAGWLFLALAGIVALRWDMGWKLLLEYLKAAAWPSVVLVLALTFRHAIVDRLSLLEKFNAFGAEATFRAGEEISSARGALEQVHADPMVEGSLGPSDLLHAEIVVRAIELQRSLPTLRDDAEESLGVADELLRERVRGDVLAATELVLRTFDYPYAHKVRGFSYEAAEYMKERTGVAGWDELAQAWDSAERVWANVAYPRVGMLGSYPIILREWISVCRLFLRKLREQMRVVELAHTDKD